MTTKEVFDLEILPLLDQVIELCREHDVPFASIYAMDEDEVWLAVMNYPGGTENESLNAVLNFMFESGILEGGDRIYDLLPPSRN